MSTNAIVGAAFENIDKDAIGKIEDAYVEKNGAVQVVILSVSGFLGIGDKHVAVKRHQLRSRRQRRRPDDQLDQGRAQGDAGLQVSRRGPPSAPAKAERV